VDFGNKIITAKVIGYCNSEGKKSDKIAQGILCEHTDEKIGTFTFPVLKGLKALPTIGASVKIRCYEVAKSNVLGKHVKFATLI